jgi:nuclear transport factor 2 (NTF2) superfamily protein
LLAEPWITTTHRRAFQYEWHDAAGQWYRSYGNELESTQG